MPNLHAHYYHGNVKAFRQELDGAAPSANGARQSSSGGRSWTLSGFVPKADPNERDPLGRTYESPREAELTAVCSTSRRGATPHRRTSSSRSLCATPPSLSTSRTTSRGTRPSIARFTSATSAPRATSLRVPIPTCLSPTTKALRPLTSSMERWRARTLPMSVATSLAPTSTCGA